MRELTRAEIEQLDLTGNVPELGVKPDTAYQNSSSVRRPKQTFKTILKPTGKRRGFRSGAPRIV